MRKIWFSRHGESEYNMFAKIGGDSNISPQGQVYAKLLPDLLVDRVPLVRSSHTLLKQWQLHLLEDSGIYQPLSVWRMLLNAELVMQSLSTCGESVYTYSLSKDISLGLPATRKLQQT